MRWWQRAPVDLFMSEAATAVRFICDDSKLADHVAREPWEYPDADTQHLTHNIHRYSGKFIPQIARRAISLLTAPGELVVDPYCGSGTTLVESVMLGRKALGIDLNPLAALISGTKVTPLSSREVNDLQEELKCALGLSNSEEEVPLSANSLKRSQRWSQRVVATKDPWFRKWFQPRVLSDLIAIDKAVRSIKDVRKQNVARVAFSDILRKSSNAHSGYPNVMFDKNVPKRSSPLNTFLRALGRVCEMVVSLEKTSACWEDAHVVVGDATALPVADSSVDAIVSHPPYIGSIPYAEYGALSLKWLGVDPKKLDQGLTGGNRQSFDVVERFRDGYRSMLTESMRILRPGRHIFLMVGDPVVRGKMIDLSMITVELAEKAGLVLVARAERAGINRRANKMGAEHLLFFKKPRKIQSVGIARRIRIAEQTSS
jgi:site-specific DNA-methyltransferase (cytosine-N4-specific)